MTLDIARQVLLTESEALRRLAENLDQRFVAALDILAKCHGRIVLTGMGKSGIVARKISATLASTGSPSLYLHPAEAIHGDLGMLARGDTVLALSNSGATPEILRLLEFIKRLSIPLIVLTGQPDSVLGRSADICLDTGDLPEACPLGLAPTTSTTAALALGDALAIALSMRKGFKLEDFAALHPGGKLGKKLRRIEDLMRTGDALPRVTMSAPMKDVIYVMSAGRMGATAVTDGAGHLQGVITDGDLRRLLSAKASILDLTAGDCMTPRPKTIDARELATSALNKMETNKITSLYIVDQDNVLIGAIHLHDLWETEMF